MTTSTVSDSGVLGARELLRHLMVPDPPPFVLLGRAGAGIELMTGTVTEVTALADLPLPGSGSETVAVIPFRQVTERGYACHDDGEPIIALVTDARARLSVPEALELLPDAGVTVTGGGFDLDDPDYERVVERIIDGEIRTGEGSNFVIRRSFTARVEDYRPEVAMTIFRRLLAAESGAHWTFLVHTGDRTFIGASPEQHVQVADGVARMNPISGTYRYPPTGADLAGVLDFLADQKEIDELYMVVDEELKMLAGVCAGGARVRGPYLREMARLAHTEYLLEGRSTLDVRDVLRATLFAPTVVGSPLENACRVIARHEPGGRGFYAGAVALLGRDRTGTSTLDSAILIRTAQVRRDGTLRVDVGATLVRDSEPAAEVAETWAKVDALLAAIGVGRPGAPAPRAGTPLATHPAVRTALTGRNDGLSSFWLATPAPTGSRATGRVLVVDAEDLFTGMLGHQLRALGHDVTIRCLAESTELAGYDAVVLGPGPGDPRDRGDPRIARLRDLVTCLLDRRVPFVAECLSHQVLCSVLGLDLHERDRPNQGTRHRIDLFGTPELVGFYNSYAARPAALPGVEVCHDAGEVHALRGDRFASTQFHIESVLTRRGPEILARLMAWATEGGAR